MTTVGYRNQNEPSTPAYAGLSAIVPALAVLDADAACLARVHSHDVVFAHDSGLKESVHRADSCQKIRVDDCHVIILFSSVGVTFTPKLLQYDTHCFFAVGIARPIDAEGVLNDVECRALIEWAGKLVLENTSKQICLAECIKAMSPEISRLLGIISPAVARKEMWKLFLPWDIALGAVRLVLNNPGPGGDGSEEAKSRFVELVVAPPEGTFSSKKDGAGKVSAMSFTACIAEAKKTLTSAGPGAFPQAVTLLDEGAQSIGPAGFDLRGFAVKVDSAVDKRELSESLVQSIDGFHNWFAMLLKSIE